MLSMPHFDGVVCKYGFWLRSMQWMQWINHIIENSKWTINRMRMLFSVRIEQEKMANFLLSSFKTCYFIWKEKKPVFNSQILWLCFTMMLWLWIFLHTFNIFYITFFSACLSFFLSHLFMATNASPHTYTHLMCCSCYGRVCLSGTFAHSRTFDLVSAVDFSSIFLPFISIHFVFIHQLLFCFFILLLSSCAFCYYSTALLGLWWFYSFVQMYEYIVGSLLLLKLQIPCTILYEISCVCAHVCVCLCVSRWLNKDSSKTVLYCAIHIFSVTIGKWENNVENKNKKQPKRRRGIL